MDVVILVLFKLTKNEGFLAAGTRYQSKTLEGERVEYLYLHIAEYKLEADEEGL